MSTDFALAYVSQRMCELGYSTNYTMRLRHLVLQPAEKRQVSIHNQLFILIEPYCNLRIESDTGIFDLSEDMANELQYEHRGDIKIINLSIFINSVRFIQVIPKFCKTPCL